MANLTLQLHAANRLRPPPEKILSIRNARFCQQRLLAPRYPVQTIIQACQLLLKRLQSGGKRFTLSLDALIFGQPGHYIR
ncbi:hypothetical protein D3C77_367610 [compost metagenome]